jgi:hypothetical protein
MFYFVKQYSSGAIYRTYLWLSPQKT